MTKYPKIGYKRFLVALTLGAALHLTAIETAQYMAAGRLISCLEDAACTQIPAPDALEQLLGYRINLGKIRVERWVKDMLTKRNNSFNYDNEETK